MALSEVANATDRPGTSRAFANAARRALYWFGPELSSVGQNQKGNDREETLLDNPLKGGLDYFRY